MRNNRIFLLILVALMPMTLLQGCGGGNPGPEQQEARREETRAVSTDMPAAADFGVPGEHGNEEAGDPLEFWEGEPTTSTRNAEIDLAPAAPQKETTEHSLAGSGADSVFGNALRAQENILHLQIGEQALTATLVENTSTAALKELLAEGPLTIEMRDYGNFEKVGDLGSVLPTNDVSFTTEPGDLILYQGNSFVIYYAPNSWSFTRLGKINNVTGDELKEILGSGNVSVTLSLNETT